MHILLEQVDGGVTIYLSNIPSSYDTVIFALSFYEVISSQLKKNQIYRKTSHQSS